MSRKNIFEILQRDYNIRNESRKLDTLVSNPVIRFSLGGSASYTTSIEEYVNEYLLLDWKYRDTITCLDEMRDLLGISKKKINQQEFEFKDFLCHLEYLSNILLLVYKSQKAQSQEWFTQIIHNIDLLLDRFNHERVVIDPDYIKVIIVEKKPEATAVAEVVEDDEISLDIIRYNHFMLKGNVYEKSKIITQLYKVFEDIRNDDITVQVGEKKNELHKDLGFLFNHIKARHKKGQNPNAAEKIERMNDNDLEKLCDMTYDMFLCAKLNNEYLKNAGIVAELKKPIKE